MFLFLGIMVEQVKSSSQKLPDISESAIESIQLSQLDIIGDIDESILSNQSIDFHPRIFCFPIIHRNSNIFN